MYPVDTLKKLETDILLMSRYCVKNGWIGGILWFFMMTAIIAELASLVDTTIWCHFNGLSIL
jgi:hypothetical protein